MRVVHITPGHFAAGSLGGGERYVQQLDRSLRAAGIATVIVSAPDYVHLARVSADGRTRPIGLSDLCDLVGYSDIVHAHQLNTFSFDVAAFVSRVAGVPLVLTDHGGSRRNPGRLLGSNRVRLLGGLAAVSPWSADEIDPRHRVLRTVLWGGGDNFSSTPDSELEFEQTDFLFVGRLLPHKGAHLLIGALPRRATLRIVGETRDEQYVDYLRFIARDRQVEFFGVAADADLPALYRSARFTVLPSVTRFEHHRYKHPELLGLVVAESLCVGTPAIGSDVGGLGDLLSEAGQIAVPPGDIAAWQVALRQALDEPPPAVPSDRYTWAAVAERCFEHYLSVIEA